MGVYGGPNIADEGLVFFYDTGNGKSYKGEPTTNLATLDLSNTSVWYSEGGTKVLQSETLDGYPVYQFRSSGSAIYVSPIAFNQLTATTNDVTLSAYFKNTGSSAQTVNVFLANDFGTDSNGDPNNRSIPADRKWYRESWTRYAAASTYNQVEFRTFSDTLLISKPQVEYKKHVTPPVEGTRSVTEGLSDLVQATSFDLTDTSYTSAAELTFDGTDDEMTIAYSDAVNTNFFTVECVAKLATADNTHKTVICRNSDVYGSYTNGWHIGTLRNGLGDFNNDWRVMFYGDSGYADLSDVAGAADGNYHHIVAGCDGTNVFLYVDGVLAGSTAKPAGNLYTSNIDIHIARNRTGNDHWDGDIPLVKFYNKALTSTEILNNFNGIKSRFGI